MVSSWYLLRAIASASIQAIVGLTNNVALSCRVKNECISSDM